MCYNPVLFRGCCMPRPFMPPFGAFAFGPRPFMPFGPRPFMPPFGPNPFLMGCCGPHSFGRAYAGAALGVMTAGLINQMLYC